jgi:probable rRNA maturation factor
VNSNIRFYSEEIRFILKQKIKTRNWLINIAREEKNSLPDINFIFCSDDYLSDLNRKYLHHDTLTDVLTFPDLAVTNKISGDIYISIDRIKENAVKYGQPFDHELARVMVHGVLHLLGYQDKNQKDKMLMTQKEDYYLNKFLFF